MAKNQAVLLKTDDYEALYVKHAGYEGWGMAEQGYTINEGEERVTYFLNLAADHEFDITELEFITLTDDELIEEIVSGGSFPMRLDAIPA